MIFRRYFPARTKLPRGTRIYAVGDIHGRADLLRQLTRRIDAHQTSHPIGNPIHIYLGDYIDRGPCSREVIDHLIDHGLHHKSVFLQGNHEAFLLAFLSNSGVLEAWQKNGGLETLISYGVVENSTTSLDAAALKAAMPKSHHAFFKRLKTSFVIGEYFFVHAGVRPGIPLSKQTKEDLLWIREDFLGCEEDFGKIVVHGHTPVSQPDVRPNRINIDTGAVKTGRLTCLVLERDEVAFI